MKLDFTDRDKVLMRHNLSCMRNPDAYELCKEYCPEKFTQENLDRKKRNWLGPFVSQAT